jgi:Tfp pilus tip-associated adhesin PilY1
MTHFMATLYCIILLAIGPVALAQTTQDYTAAPPFLDANLSKPNVVIALDISGSMKEPAYGQAGINWRTGVHNDYDPDKRYFGYFDADADYDYAAETGKQFFYEKLSGPWDGNFLNWLSMRRMDVVRRVLVGGKIDNRSGTEIAGQRWYILEGQNEPYDYTFKKSYSQSATVSTFPNNSEILISNGSITRTTSNNSQIVALTSSVEMGKVSFDQDNRSDTYRVNFTNTYNQKPVVVATALSFNGSDPAMARVSNITLQGFDVKIDEWHYRDGSHTTEDITFIVATPGTHSIPIQDDQGQETQYTLAAGRNSLAKTNPRTFSTVNYGHNFSSLPVVFAGTQTLNNTRPITTRIQNVDTVKFEAALQNENAQLNYAHGSEDVGWIAIEPLKGLVSNHSLAIEIALTGSTHTHDWKTINFQKSFSNIPIIAAGLQTTREQDAAVLRYGNGGVTSTGFSVRVEEEKSISSNNTLHNNAEVVGFIALEAAPAYRIRVGSLNEPRGIIQDNAHAIRFGIAVYNYDHSLNPTAIYDKNTLHGGTLRPCYPDVKKPVADQTNFDICLDTHVRSPLSNIMDVIEDHPLIWGTTPIAETLYEIKGYFAQKNHGRNGHNQWYDNGTESTATPRSSYEISTDWDPYYYPEANKRLPCAKSFVLHFNDGAPFKDFDGTGHPTIINDNTGQFGSEQMLDDLALMLRNEDCRTDLDEHQDIVSYYIYAALGETESLNDDSRRMREAAANGGFVDHNKDNLPTPAHPTDFNAYVQAGNCTPNEWDADGDCNPDTFYFANDAENLIQQLNAAFEAIVTRSGSGGSASVIAASRSGEGAVYNAIFRPSIAANGQQVTWVGDVHALLIDSAGFLRQDDGDKKLEDSDQDPYVDMCTDISNNTKEVRIKLSSSLSEKPSATDLAACNGSQFNKSLFDLNYLWSAASWLSSLSDEQAINQRSYTATTLGRYIFTGFDSNNDGMITADETAPFTSASFPEERAGLLDTQVAKSHQLIDFIRGKDFPGLRNRQYRGKTYRLGDVIYSTPTAAGRPAENLDLLYKSQSYRQFFEHYRYRRQVVYAGGNDGMLHAFNAGWYDTATKTFKPSKGSAPGSTLNFDLGAELWAYVPYHGSGHLRYLAKENYGTSIQDHVYFMDLEPRIFDAKIFTPDADHPGGWGTVLVVGSRFGGGSIALNADLSGQDTRALGASYVILDVTNPDKPPKLLLEFHHPEMGFASALPAPIVTGQDNDGNGDWYLLLGSGPDNSPSGFDDIKSTQKAKLFLLDLKKVAAGQTPLVTTFGNQGIVTLDDNTSFITDLTSVDFGLDKFTTDAVYFGTVSGTPGDWKGSIYRLVIQENTGDQSLAPSAWALTKVYDTLKPITGGIAVGTDTRNNRWMYAGTGRFYTSADKLDTASHYFYGIKEPRTTTGSLSYATHPFDSLTKITNTQVKSSGGTLQFPPTLIPALPENATIAQFEERMKDNSTRGWQRNFQPGERNFGLASLLGNTLTYTTFTPEENACFMDGRARLYVVNALTGTAGSPAILPGADNSEFHQYVLELGSSPATSPSLHIGEGYDSSNQANAIIQTSDGTITTVKQHNANDTQSGEISWRQLF